MRHTGGPLRASGVGDCVRRNAALPYSVLEN